MELLLKVMPPRIVFFTIWLLTIKNRLSIIQLFHVHEYVEFFFFKDTSEITEKQGTLLIHTGKTNKYLEMFQKIKHFVVYVR